MKVSETIERSEERKLPMNILILAPETEKVILYIEKFVKTLNGEIIQNGMKLPVRIYEINRNYLCFIPQGYELESILNQLDTYSFINQTFCLCAFLEDSFGYPRFLEQKEIILKKFHVERTQVFSFEQTPLNSSITENSTQDYDIAYIPYDNFSPFLDILSDNGKMEKRSPLIQKSGTNLYFKMENKSKSQNYLHKKRRKFFNIEKVPRFKNVETKTNHPQEIQNNAFIIKTSDKENLKQKLEESKFAPKDSELLNAGRIQQKGKLDEANENSVSSSHHSNLGPNNNEKENDDEEEETDSAFTKNSLKAISREVYKYIINKKETKGGNVTNHILELLKSKGKSTLNYKNIQRRVYDAINVMAAFGIIKKDKGYIKISNKAGISSESDGSSSGNSYITSDTLVHQPKSQDETHLEHLQNETQRKKKELMSKITNVFFYKKMLEQNKGSVIRCNSPDKLEFPFFIILLDKDSPYQIQEEEGANRALIYSQNPFHVIDPENISKLYIQNEMTESSLKGFLNEDLFNYIHENNLLNDYFKDIPAQIQNFKIGNLVNNDETKDATLNMKNSAFSPSKDNRSHLVEEAEECFNIEQSNYQKQENCNIAGNFRHYRKSSGDSINNNNFEVPLSYFNSPSNCVSQGVSPFIKKYK